MFVLHIKLKGMKCLTTYKQKFFRPYNFAPGGQKVTTVFFLKMVMYIAYQIKGSETYYNMQANILPLHVTPSAFG